MIIVPDPLIHMNVFCLVTGEPPSFLVVRFKLGVTVLSVLIWMNVKDAYNLLHAFALPQLVERDLWVKLLQFVQVAVVFFELAIEFERLGFSTRLRVCLFLQQSPLVQVSQREMRVIADGIVERKKFKSLYCRLSDLKAHFCQDCCPLLAPETGRGDFWIKSLPHNVNLTRLC